MIKYTVYKETFEVKEKEWKSYRSMYTPGDYHSTYHGMPSALSMVAEFDNEDDALEILYNQCVCDVSDLKKGNAWNFYEITEYWMEADEYYDNGEFDQSLYETYAEPSEYMEIHMNGFDTVA